MNILNLILRNLRGGPLTLRFPQRPPSPPGLRGLVQLNPEMCLGCGTCSYVCTSAAIQVTDCVTAFDWSYDAARCTFCGRCADVCPVSALAMQAERPPIYSERGALAQTHHINYPLCPECGEPTNFVNDALLARVFGEITERVNDWSRSCPRCRARHSQPAWRERIEHA